MLEALINILLGNRSYAREEILAQRTRARQARGAARRYVRGMKWMLPAILAKRKDNH